MSARAEDLCPRPESRTIRQTQGSVSVAQGNDLPYAGAWVRRRRVSSEGVINTFRWLVDQTRMYGEGLIIGRQIDI